MTEYDDSGPVVPWTVKAGDPIVKTWTVTVAGSTADLTGATLTGYIRTAENAGGSPAYTFTMSSPSAGKVKAKLSSGIATTGRYWWAIKVALANGETVWRGQGPLIVEPAGV